MRPLVLSLLFATIVPATAAQLTKPSDPYSRFKQNAAAAVAAEQAREKLKLCRNPKDAIEQITCPDDEFRRSDKGYLQLTHAISALLRSYEANGGDDDQANEDRIAKDFDMAEAIWAKYREAQCGTLGSDLEPHDTRGHATAYVVSSCNFAVTRQHIYELNAVYNWLWTR